MNNPPNFVTADVIATRLQLSTELDGVTDTLNSASASAQLFLETLLESKLALQTWDVLYYLDSEYFSGVRPQGFMRIMLPSGFVRNDPVNYPITMGFATKWNAVQTPVDKTFVKIDYDRGIIYVDPVYADNYVRVQCTTGYKLGTAGEQQDDGSLASTTANEDIPDWMQEAIIAYVPAVLRSNRNADPGKATDVDVSGNRALDIVAKYLRNIGFCFQPM